MISRALLAIGALAVGACVGCAGTSDPHRPGVELGTFHVLASQTMTTCGAGALGSTADWAFDMKLSRGETNLFWDNGAELIPGTLGDDNVTFSFKTEILVDMRAGQAGPLPPCSIRRTDTAAGKLDSADTGVTSFVGSLAYAFAPEPGPTSDCSDVVSGPMPALAALPCSMAYDLKATLSKPPSGGAAEIGAGSPKSPPD